MALYLVTGPPAAGKSTWVRLHAKHGDIVIDLDLIAGVLTAPGGETHRHPRPVRDVSHRARAAAIKEALKHRLDVDVYIIHSLPPAELRERYGELGAHVVTIDPGRDVVMARIAEQRPSFARAVAERWYAQASQPHTQTDDAVWLPGRSSRAW
jgi:hypothetical protein